jgi:sulfur transfer protein SufE
MKRHPSEIIEIPSPRLLQERLNRILQEAKRLRLLIRTGRQLEIIANEKATEHSVDDEVAP